MKPVLLLALCVTLVTSAAAQSNFQLGAISTTKQRFDLNGTTTTYEFIETRITVPVDMRSSDLVIVAYYFSEDKKPLGGFKGGLALRQSVFPKERGRRVSGQITMPEKLEAGKKYEFQFMVPEEAAKWKRVIVVLGKEGDLVGKIYPKDDWTKFDFKDKASVRMLQ